MKLSKHGQEQIKRALRLFIFTFLSSGAVTQAFAGSMQKSALVGAVVAAAEVTFRQFVPVFRVGLDDN